MSETASETAEEQILIAAQQSIQNKSHQLGQLSPESLQRLVTEIQPLLNTKTGGVGDFLNALPDAANHVLDLLKQLSQPGLEQLHEALGSCYTSLFPPEKPASLISGVKSLVLADFDDEEEEEDGFMLLDFDAAPKDSPAAREALRQSLWLLLQLSSAWYYVHHVAPTQL